MTKLLTASVMLCAVAANAADISMINEDAQGTSSFISAGNWSDALPPSAGKTYLANKTFRTPENSSDYVFAGDRLTLLATFAWKTIGTITVSNLVSNGGTLAQWMSNGARLYGNVTVNSGTTWTIQALEPSARWFEIYAPISGSGAIELQMNQTNTLKQASFLADNSGFTGQIRLRGKGKFGICSEEGLGANPTTFTYNELDFGGTTLILTNSLTLDDPNRGLNLNTLTTDFNAPGGVFEVNNQATATVACVISGAGPLTKRGNGTLVLATNNTYTGLTTVEAGTLRLTAGVLPTSASMVASGATAVVAGQGSLSNVTLAAGAQLLAEKTGWDVLNLLVSNSVLGVDLSQAESGMPLIRVSGTLTKIPFQVFQFAVNTNGASSTPYKILSATNLSSFADCDFCVTPPWIGQLSRADDGAGGQVLLFTLTPPDKIILKTATDISPETAFTDGSKWADGMVPSVDKTYLYNNNGYTFRTPQTGDLTFPGGRLILDNNVTLALKGGGTPTITNLVVMNDANFGMWEGVGSKMAGDILMYPICDAGKTYALRVASSNMGRNLDLYSVLSGYGDLLLQGQGDPAYAVTAYSLFGDNTGYLGKIRVDGNTNVWLRVSSEAGIGGVPPAFRADQLSFNGGGISVTNDVTLDDANRGVTLLATGGTSGTIGTSPSAGGYTNGTSAALLHYEGGCTLRPEGTNTLTVTCPITGPGMLIKAGAGLLVLGGANTYTGQTQIISGTLEPISVSALGVGPVLLKPEGRLLRRYPGPTLPNGVTLGSTITFESGSQIVIQLDEVASITGTFSVPLFTMPTAVAVDPATVPVTHSLQNYKATVITTDLDGSRTLFSAQLRFQGSVMMLR